MKIQSDFEIRPALIEDVPVILELIRDLATYERAPNEVTATEEQLVDVLFGNDPPRKFFSHSKENPRSGLLFSFTIFPHGSGDPGFI